MRVFNGEDARADARFFSGYISKYSAAYIFVLATILLFEVIMMARGVVVFDFARQRHRMYFLSYAVLFVATAIGLALTLRHRRGKVSDRAITLALHGYCTAIIAWSLLVSWLDLTVGNTPIVYLMVIMSIGGLSVVHPVYYGALVLMSFGIILGFNNGAKIPYFDSTSGGVFFNLSMFVVTSLVLATRHYSVSRREMELTRRLEGLSYRDPLTGIYNRRMYDDELSRIDREDEGVMIGLIDLDDFKRINDQYGHDFGDTCLSEVGLQLSRAFGERVYRIGGDEFTAICGMSADGVAGTIDRINRRLETSFPGRTVSISAGFCARGAGVAARSAAEYADKALYAAKGGGGKRCRIGEVPGQGEASRP